MNKALKPALRQPLVSGSVARPISFSTLMVRGILSGRKTQTRRILKEQLPIGVKWWEVCYGELNCRIVDIRNVYTHCKCPYGKLGDLLWVREAFELVPVETASIYENESRVEHRVKYKADGKACFNQWKSGRFLKKSHSRLWLKITNIKVERLQSISEEDARREGVKYNLSLEFNQYLNYEKGIYQCPSAVESFKSLWSEINGQKSWSENPFVWVIQFERVELPEHYR